MTVATRAAPDIWRRLGLHSPWTERLLLVVFVFLMRLPGYRPSVIGQWDEGYYALAARELLTGGLPYASIFLDKPLGAIVLFAGALGVFGDSIWGIRLLGSLSVAATTLILRETALVAGLSRFAATGVALLYASSSIEQGMDTNIEILLGPYSVGAAWLGLRYRNATQFSTQCWTIAAAGFLVGISVWCKYVPAIPGCMLFFLLVGSWLLRGFVTWQRIVPLSGIYLVMCLLPTIATGMVYAGLGQWDAFWYSNFGFMQTYVSLSTSASEFAHPVLEIAFPFIWAGMDYYQPFILGLIGLVFWRTRPVFVALMLAWFAAELGAVVAPGKYWGHYFLLLLPPLCLLAGVGLDGLARWIVPIRLRETLASLPVVTVAIIMIAYAIWDSPNAWARYGYPDPERKIAEILRHDPKASVWVINQEPTVYLLSGLRSPTVYVFSPHLVGEHSALMRSPPETELRRILNTRPRYLVLDPNKEKAKWMLPHMRGIIMNEIDGRYQLLEEIPGRYGPVMLYRIRE